MFYTVAIYKFDIYNQTYKRVSSVEIILGYLQNRKVQQYYAIQISVIEQ